MQQLLDAYLDALPTCVTVLFPPGYDWTALDLHGRAAGTVDEPIVEYLDANGTELLRHTIPG